MPGRLSDCQHTRVFQPTFDGNSVESFADRIDAANDLYAVLPADLFFNGGWTRKNPDAVLAEHVHDVVRDVGDVEHAVDVGEDIRRLPADRPRALGRATEVVDADVECVPPGDVEPIALRVQAARRLDGELRLDRLTANIG